MLRRELSFGVIPYRTVQDKTEVFLVQHRDGAFWSFPKGHAEKGETPLETATRELLEETNLEILHLDKGEAFVEAYSFERKGIATDKEVKYFLAEVKGSVKLQDEELMGGKWYELSDVESRLTYASAKRVWEKALERIMASW